VGLGGYKLLDRGWEIPMTDGVVAEGVAEVTRILDAAMAARREEERVATRAWMDEILWGELRDPPGSPEPTVYDPTGTVFANPDPE
jgi:hypothetical protein